MGGVTRTCHRTYQSKGGHGCTHQRLTRNREISDRNGQPWVSFTYEHEDGSVGVRNEAPIEEFRDVTNSGGQSESRPVIKTPLKLGEVYKLVELTLTQRDNMAYRMLVGRTTLSSEFVVAPAESFVLGGDESTPGNPE